MWIWKVYWRLCEKRNLFAVWCDDLTGLPYTIISAKGFGC